MTLDIKTLLGPDGPVATRLDNYEVRPEQIEMAQAVETALDNKGHLLVEAGTGVGKSFAYLAPAIKRIIEKKERVVIATNTISLQEQLIEKDIPLLNAVIPDEFTSVLVKGRSNYLSQRRLKLASERQEKLFYDEISRNSLHKIEDWAYDTRDGTLSTLPQLQRHEVWDYVQSDSHNCMGKKCPTFQKCFFQAARRRMENGDLLICNHALFFADLALRSQGVSMLPTYDHVILDEAHSLEDVAADHFGLSLTESRVKHLLNLLYRPHNGSGFLSSLTLKDGTHKPVDSTIELVLQCLDAADRFFGELRLWYDKNERCSGEIHEENIVPNSITPSMKELANRLHLLKKKTAREADEFELNSYAERALDISRQANLIINRKIDDCVYWMDISQSKRYKSLPPRVSLRCAPIEVGPILQEQLFGRETSVVMTSATLATGENDFSHIQSRLGCENAETIQLGSPFDHATQVKLYVDRTMPDPKNPRFTDELEPRVLNHIKATDGGAFVLFTSFSMLREMAERLAEKLLEEDYALFVQGTDGPRNIILKRFRKAKRGVLFGTSSFWQGVDVRGDALRNVIITRLPFEVPDKPLVKARHKRIEEQGGNPFFKDQVPRAVIRFKQGFGRLIRSSTDSGRVVVLDPRIVTKPYGRAFLKALPEGITVDYADDPCMDLQPDHDPGMDFIPDSNTDYDADIAPPASI